jgi:hypothetical protein
MPSAAANVPAETDVLCEECGYRLTGLPPTGVCPECGEPISASLDPRRRTPTAWELRGPRGFLSTTAQVIFRPRRFYRGLATRAGSPRAATFAYLHWSVAAVLLCAAVYLHYEWQTTMSGSSTLRIAFSRQELNPLILLGGAAAIFCLQYLVTWVASRLTAFEAAYRGYRLPPKTVLRGLYYHAAHISPVAALALVTVLGYQILLCDRVVQMTSGTTYLYVLCGQVILSATYLFVTYWIGMRNMMFANR